MYTDVRRIKYQRKSSCKTEMIGCLSRGLTCLSSGVSQLNASKNRPIDPPKRHVNETLQSVNFRPLVSAVSLFLEGLWCHRVADEKSISLVD